MFEKATSTATTAFSEKIIGPIVSNIVGIVLIVVIHKATVVIAARLLKPAIATFIRRYETPYRHHFYKQKLERNAANVVSGILLLLLIPLLISGDEQLITRLQDLAAIFTTASFAKLLLKIVDAYHDMYKSLTVEYRIPIVGYVQIIKLTVYVIGAIFMVSILFNVSVAALVGGLGILLGAMAFIFKDTILGFVAVIQMTANKMVGIGDWIKVPTHAADGNVLEISLSTVKVRNWNNTIVMIPTYALIGGSFSNWEAMKKKGFRRIKERVPINSQSIVKLTPTVIKNARANKLTKQTMKIIEKQVDLSSLDSNLTLYRLCLLEYLKNHTSITKKRAPAVRTLAPTELGTPLDMIAFSAKTGGESFFHTKSNIIEHAMILMPVFDLVMFQRISDK